MSDTGLEKDSFMKSKRNKKSSICLFVLSPSTCHNHSFKLQQFNAIGGARTEDHQHRSNRALTTAIALCKEAEHGHGEERKKNGFFFFCESKYLI